MTPKLSGNPGKIYVRTVGFQNILLTQFKSGVSLPYFLHGSITCNMKCLMNIEFL